MENNTNELNLIKSFFNNQEEYIHFLVNLKGLVIANDEATVFAELIKEENYYLYTLTWLKDIKFIGDYVKPFRATKENIEIFNNGCKILAQRLETFIETNDVTKVPMIPPAFGILTFEKQ
jgi:hypothetical protein